MTKYTYSLDEERYHGSFDSIEEALTECGQQAEEDALEEGEHTRTVWVGEIADGPSFLRERNPDWVGQHIEEDAEAYLAYNIGWDDQLIDLSSDQRRELGLLVTEWLCKNADFLAYGVRNAKEYTVKVGAAND